MELSKLFITLLILQAVFPSHSSIQAAPTDSNLFREYIGAEFNNVKFTDVPINPNVELHFILSFAIDYDTSSSPSPTNGKFNIFWDSGNLSPSQVSSIKSQHSNVKVALSLGGDSVGDGSAYFNPSSVDSWVSNAVSSLTNIIKQYNLDGIDIDYEHFNADPDTFANCIGQLITTLKNNGVISFASIAPFDDDQVQSHYLALWKSYGHLIDYVNFQFYAYDQGTTVSQFMNYFKTQSSKYNGGKVLVSFTSDGSGGLSPANGFFTAFFTVSLKEWVANNCTPTNNSDRHLISPEACWAILESDSEMTVDRINLPIEPTDPKESSSCTARSSSANHGCDEANRWLAGYSRKFCSYS